MPRLSSLPHRTHRSRLLALLVFAVQAAIAVSPLWEAGRETRVRIHAEQHGSRHIGMHDDATCPVCAVRAVHAAPALSASLEILAAPVHAPLAIERTFAPSRALSRANSTRAPPALVG